MPNEDLLRYWREDSSLNDHHEHWHLVYRYEGRAQERSVADALANSLAENKTTDKTWDKRHGEIFAYMHSQMLARYAAERLSHGLPAVVPLDDYRQPIKDGYDPRRSTFIKFGGEKVAVGSRPDETVLQDVTVGNFARQAGSRVDRMEAVRDNLLALSLAPDSDTSIATLGERVEATSREADGYGSLHNDGHQLIALQTGDPARPGVMYYEVCAIRDPVFWRWHAHIDRMFRNYQDGLPPYDFDNLPEVQALGLRVVSSSGQQDRIETRMLSYQTNVDGALRQVKFLSHEDYSYQFFIIGRTGPDPVTVRIFMAPEATMDDRASWMEMDKFSVEVKKGPIYVERSSRDSSVVRHPIVTAEMLRGLRPRPSTRGRHAGCDCGWPYTLLIPRGTAEGLPMRLVAVVTRGDDLAQAARSKSSASYCGLRDAEYPDKQEMGFPFNRPWAGSIKQSFESNALPRQFTSAHITIAHRG